MSRASWTVTARDFRGLRGVDWSPSGVCLLAGPNGAGKSSILGILSFLQAAATRGVAEAVRLAGGGAHLRRLGAARGARVQLSLAMDDVTWAIGLPVEEGGINPNHAERVLYGSETIAYRDAGVPLVFLGMQGAVTTFSNPTSNPVAFPVSAEVNTFIAPGSSVDVPSELSEHTGRLAPELVRGQRWLPDSRNLLQMLSDTRGPSNLPSAVSKALAFARDLRVHRPYALDQIREPQSTDDAGSRLQPDGRNAWALLREWKSAPRKHGDQFAWVMRALRAAFPELVTDLEFESLGQTIMGRFYPPDAANAHASLPLQSAADGLLVGILHLTAVAGAPEGSLLAFDEVENQLHPHAIRAILRAMRERADERDLAIVLATHSPIVMNEFKGREDQLYILEDGHATLPIALDKARDPEWLAHFSLGDLYDREDFAAQARIKTPPHAAE